jgi:hypothetical protein
VFGAITLFFVHRSFYGMRITGTSNPSTATKAAPAE